LRVFCFRIAAVLLGLLPLLLVELALSLLGWSDPQLADDPFVGFRSTRPLFVRNAETDVYETAPNRLEFFRPESFSASKAPNEFRIFCLGGSTVQGRPFAIETSFTTWLELSLQAIDPSRHWQVVNCGGVSYASYRLVPVLEEVLQYDPDLVILYTGHNEFLEDRTYGFIKRRPALVTTVIDAASRLRTFTLLRAGVRRWTRDAPTPAKDRPVLPEEVQALLDYEGGLKRYHWDESWRRGVMDHFEYNLRRMVALCRQRGVPVWLADPVCNLRDCPPFKSQHRDGLTDDEQKQWDSLRRQASACYRTDMRKSTRLLEQASDLDGQFAGLHYDLAKCYEALGRNDQARQAYQRATDLDVCPLRILEPMNQAVNRVCRQLGVVRIPVRDTFVQRCRNGIPGGFLLVDHVHPSIPGHQSIAEILVDQFVAQSMTEPKLGWKTRREELFREHTETLDDWYYLEGQRRLESLRDWAQGRSTLAPP
jgi:tetratricopeptide (TPR) repeat protein